MHHYTYLLIDDTNDMYYIGKRSCKCLPEEDINYLSSSSYVVKDKCEKLILNIFTTAQDAIKDEIYLHQLHDVGVNPKFYNKAKQTSTKFDTTGINFSLTSEQKAKISKANLNKKRSKATILQMTEHLKQFRTPEVRAKAAKSLRKNGSNAGSKNSQFKPWYITYSTVTHFFYDISKNEKALQDGFPKKYYTDTAKKCKHTNLPVHNRKGQTIFVGNIPN